MPNHYTLSTVPVLNHFSLPSDDLTATGAFFETYLGCTVEHKTSTAWILKQGDVDIVIEAATESTSWPRNFHFGLQLPSVAAVKDLYAVWQRAGVELTTEVFNNQRGSRFFARCTSGPLVEVNTREDMAAELWRNNR